MHEHDLASLRAVCLALPKTTEVAAELGRIAWHAGRRPFAVLADGGSSLEIRTTLPAYAQLIEQAEFRAAPS